jgi:hypothetical protein
VCQGIRQVPANNAGAKMTTTKTPEHTWEPSTPYENKEATLRDALQQALAALRLLAPTCLADAGRQDDAIEAA